MAAFEELYRAHSGRVYALCLRMAGDAARAEDLAQETFVRAWQRLHSFRGASAFSTWLHRLTVNVVISWMRKRRRRTERELASTAPAADIAGAVALAVPPSRTGTRLDLEGAIAALPPRARAVFVLYEIEGRSHREIAALTGMAEGTSKTHLHRARRQLREALAR